jgi:hypothetical protein
VVIAPPLIATGSTLSIVGRGYPARVDPKTRLSAGSHDLFFHK